LVDSATHYLIGAGVVGRAIARAHLSAGISFALVDQDSSILQAAFDELELDHGRWHVTDSNLIGGSPAIVIVRHKAHTRDEPPLVIESIAERLDVKQAFFAAAEQFFGADAILCSNTSTLRIGDIAAGLSRPERFCGMHFFMPVDQRSAVEIVDGADTSAATVTAVAQRARRLNKQPLIVGDGPGFIVNRLLSPYLNEAMLMLGAGVDAAQLECAALEYGMPISPLELIDWIGTRTVFDAGRVFWQAFPNRIRPSPIAAALLKRGRQGRAGGGGFYDYSGGARSTELAPATRELVESYQRETVAMDDAEVVHRLAVPMFIEAALAFRAGIARDAVQFDLAMTGGLGYDADRSWLGFFDGLGSQRVREVGARGQHESPSLTVPRWLDESLARHAPSAALYQAGNVKD